jgi:hypothetical protein
MPPLTLLVVLLLPLKLPMMEPPPEVLKQVKLLKQDK